PVVTLGNYYNLLTHFTNKLFNALHNYNYSSKDGAPKKQRTEYKIKSSDFWLAHKKDDELYMSLLKLELEDEKYDGQCYRTLCLLSRKQIRQVPSTTLFFHS